MGGIKSAWVRLVYVNLLDVLTTLANLKQGTGYEANPIMRYIIHLHGPVIGLFGAKIVFLLFAWFYMRLIYKGPSEAILVNASAGLLAFVVVWNLLGLVI